MEHRRVRSVLIVFYPLVRLLVVDDKTSDGHDHDDDDEQDLNR